MTEAVLTLSRASFKGMTNLASGSYEKLGFSRPAREVIVLGLVLAMLQIWDGVLTGVGMHRFGLMMEGNIFMRFIMEQFGAVGGLVLAKSAALAVIVFLVVISHKIEWLPRALRGMIALYLVAAIIPWTAILLGN